MRLGRESQFSAITRVGILLLFGLASGLSASGGLARSTFRVLDAIPSSIYWANDQIARVYPSLAWPSRSVDRDFIGMLQLRDNSDSLIVATLVHGDGDGAARDLDESHLGSTACLSRGLDVTGGVQRPTSGRRRDVPVLGLSV
jgi:hypothetical protein